MFSARMAEHQDRKCREVRCLHFLQFYVTDLVPLEQYGDQRGDHAFRNRAPSYFVHEQRIFTEKGVVSNVLVFREGFLRALHDSLAYAVLRKQLILMPASQHLFLQRRTYQNTSTTAPCMCLELSYHSIGATIGLVGVQPSSKSQAAMILRSI